jgi:hypothetical protein
LIPSRGGEFGRSVGPVGAAAVFAFLVAALAVVVGLLGAGPASAATASGAQNAVGASTFAAPASVGPPGSISPDQWLGNDPPQPGFVVATGVAANSGVAQAGPAEAAAALRARLAQQAGFGGSGPKIIVDENLPSSWARGLRSAGYDARSIAEMEIQGASDVQINRLAEQVGARVLTRDVGHQLDGGFGSNAITIDSRVRSLDSVLRLIGGG